jgi:dihydroflavonol-4-reductase
MTHPQSLTPLTTTSSCPPARVLVTGAAGFLGTHAVRALRHHGHDVVALVRRDAPALAASGVTMRRGDVLDPVSVRDAAEGCDVVLHCAGKVSRDPRDAEALYRVHVTGTRTVLDACRQAGVRRAVIASTSGTVAVGDDPAHVANEDDATPMGLIAAWPYYRAKLFAERAALEGSDDTLGVVAVNPSLMLGPGDVNGSSTEDVRLFLEGKIGAVPSGGLSYVDVRDVAEAMRLAITRGAPGRRYLLGACNLTFREFFARLERVSGVPGPWLPLPAPLSTFASALLRRLSERTGAPPPVDPESLALAKHYWYVDARRAEAELGWSPRDPIATLADTVEDLRARGVVWPAASSLAPSATAT